MRIEDMFKMIKIEELMINAENFRHNPVIDEEQAIIELIKDSGDTSSKSIYDIAQSINNEGYYPQEIISVYFSDKFKKYILLDGNRRVTAIKLSKNPSLIPDSFKKIKSKFENLILDKINDLSELPCFIYKNIIEAIEYLKTIHTAGSGPKSWGRLQQLRFLEVYGTQNDLTYGYKVCKQYLTPQEIEESKNFSTVERVLKKSLFESIFEESKQKIYSKDEKRNLLLKLITDTNKKTFNSRALNTIDDIKNYINGELSVELINSVNETNEKTIEVNSPKPQEHVFTNITFTGLDHNKPIENSLIHLCSELKEITKLKNFEKFKISATCLIRNVLEVSLKYWLNKYYNSIYINIVKKTDRDPSLGELIDEILKCLDKSHNINIFKDEEVNTAFILTFGDGERTKTFLDTLVHRPYLLSLNANDLKINNNTSLYRIIQHILNYQESLINN